MSTFLTRLGINTEEFVIISVILLIISLIIFLYIFLRNPFEFPYKEIEINVSGKRKPNIYDNIDEYLIKNRMQPFDDHFQLLQKWKEKCRKKISKSPFKKRRNKQFNKALDEARLFWFSLIRVKTRYRQVNYVRHPYKVSENVGSFAFSYDYIKSRYIELETINFETVLSDYHSKEQRKLMTKDLRERIARRDNYTCQICGKYMPDGVGLQIDHIQPVAKGGKSIPSNLQVLCSKCNGRKSSNG